MNQYIYTVQVARLGMLQEATATETEVAQAHLAYIADLFKRKSAIFAGATGGRDASHIGLVIYQAEDDAAAQAILHHDPAVKARIMRGRWFPYRIALWNPTVANLAPDEAHYFYHIQPVRPEMLHDGGTEFEQKTIGAHFAFLKALVDKGVCAFAGRTLNNDYSNFGLAIIKATSLDEAWAISEADPAVRERVMRLTIQPFGLNEIQTDFNPL